MFNFKQELDKLLAQEDEPPASAPEEVARAEQRVMAAFGKKQEDISLQVEEIYDLVNEMDAKEIKAEFAAERKRSRKLLESFISLADMTDDFNAFAAAKGDRELLRQLGLTRKNTDELMTRCGLSRMGFAGEGLDPQTHTVMGAEESDLPFETVTSVLRSGYRYMGDVIRKASVIVSGGRNRHDEG